MIRVLLAEDQALVRGALSALLNLEDDIEVVGCVADGAAAFAAAQSLQPDVIVSDVEMPGTTGLELAEMIAAGGVSSGILIVTTFGKPGYLRRAMEAGVRGYLLKEAPPNVLAAAIRTVAAGRRVISSELVESLWSAPVNPLSARERAVLRLVDEGRSNKEIAQVLKLSPGTVRNYLSAAAAKLQSARRMEAARVARENGWL